MLSQHDILACSDDGQITFRYRDSKTRQYQTRTLHGADFLWPLLQHVLPRGFRRARNYAACCTTSSARCCAASSACCAPGCPRSRSQ